MIDVVLVAFLLVAVFRGKQMEFFREIDLGLGDVEEALAEKPAGDDAGSD